MGFRASAPNNVHVWLDHNNFVGVSCGWDFTAEHEWGIERLHESFGLDKSKTGLASRTVTKTPYVGLDEFEGVLYLWHRPQGKPFASVPEHFVREVKPVRQDNYAGWGEESFCFATKDGKTKKRLKTLHAAFAEKDVAIYLGGREFIGNCGLILAIASKIPAETVSGMLEVDRKYAKRAKAT